MVNVEKHPHASLKYPGSTVMNLPAGDSELEPPLCQTCLSDHPFQRGIAPQEAESCSWESQRNSKVSHSLLPTSFFTCFVLKTGLHLQWTCIYEMVYPWKRRDVSKPETLLTKMCCAHLGSAFYLKIWYPWKTKDYSLQCCDVQYLNRLPVIINTIPLFYRNWGEDRWYYLSKIRKRTQTCYFFPLCPTSKRPHCIPSTSKTMFSFIFRNQNLARGVFPNRKWIIQEVF